MAKKKKWKKRLGKALMAGAALAGGLALAKNRNINDMIKGDVIFCATGVTTGDLVNGIKTSKDFFEAETLVLHKSGKINKKIKNRIKK